jgi:hypothetical protein
MADEAFDILAERMERGFRQQQRAIAEAKATAIGAQRVAALRSTPKPLPSARSILVKSVVAKLVARDANMDPVVVAQELYGQERKSEWITKAVTDPAMTTVTGWAKELAATGIYPGMLASLAPASVYSQLATLGLRLELGSNAAMKLPYRADTPAGNPFVGEGQPIPIRAFSLAVDAVLLGNAAATAAQPPGLMLNAAEITPAAAGPDAIASDLVALVGSIVPAPLSPVFIMNPVQAVNASLLLANGTSELTVIVSDSVPAGTVIALDSDDFATATGDRVALDIVEDAAIVSSDPAVPLATGASGAGAISGSPALSLWQHNLFAIRALEFISWAMRRGGRVSYAEGVNW